MTERTEYRTPRLAEHHTPRPAAGAASAARAVRDTHTTHHPLQLYPGADHTHRPTVSRYLVSAKPALERAQRPRGRAPTD